VTSAPVERVLVKSEEFCVRGANCYPRTLKSYVTTITTSIKNSIKIPASQHSGNHGKEKQGEHKELWSASSPFGIKFNPSGSSGNHNTFSTAFVSKGAAWLLS